MIAKDLLAKWNIDFTQTIGLIFDVDELLFDNAGEIFLAYRSLLDVRGIEMEIKETFPGKDLFDIITRIKEKYAIKDDVEVLVEERKGKYLELLKKTGSSVKKGVKEIFSFLDQNRHQMNIRWGYATSSERVFVDIILQKVFQSCGLWHYLENNNYNNLISLTCWEPGMQKKPNPMLYLKAVEKIGLFPRQCIAFEDSRSGMASALAAGLGVIIVPSPSNEEAFKDLQPCYFTEKRFCMMESLLDFLPVLSALINNTYRSKNVYLKEKIR